MITFLEGELVEKRPTDLVMNVGGVGYEVFIPLSSYDRLPGQGARCRILVYDCVREDSHSLYGFMTEAERHMFRLLMGTSGIGPKLALSALSGLSVRELKVAVVEGDVKRLSSISGVGRKMAERLVVELRDRIGEGEALEALSGSGGGEAEAPALRDAVRALVSLGYKEDAARKMVAAAAEKFPDVDVEQLIRHALAG